MSELIDSYGKDTRLPSALADTHTLPGFEGTDKWIYPRVKAVSRAPGNAFTSCSAGFSMPPACCGSTVATGTSPP